MTGVTTINPRIVEALYIEALVLSDAARSRFDQLRAQAGLQQRAPRAGQCDHRVRPDDVEVMCEALRTTTRVMHCLAWLLNHRAWFAGEISAVQLRRHGRLIRHFPASDPQIVRRLPHDLVDLVDESERLYARIQRLESAWRAEQPAHAGTVERLHIRLAATNTLRHA